MGLHFKNTNKDVIMTKEVEEDHRNINICRFREKNFESDKIRDLCPLTGDYRGPDHSKCNNNVTQKQSLFIPIYFTILVTMIVIYFFDKIVDEKNDRVKFDIIPKTNEEYI